jgi:3-hydroxyisobutyrate dehydrogenase
VTAGGRSAGFPLFLCSATEQVLASGVSAGLGAIDDAALVGVYLPRDPTLVLKLASTSTNAEEDEKKLKIVAQLMAGVHLAAAAEAMSLGTKVGLEPKQLYGIIAGAAGNSFIFSNRTPQLLSGKWTSTKTVDNVIAELVHPSPYCLSEKMLI